VSLKSLYGISSVDRTTGVSCTALEHGSHLTLDLLNFCRENNIIIVLRPPHTTHKLQGEDVQNFKNIKADFLKSKMDLLSKIVTEAVNKGQKIPSGLGLKHLMRVLTPVWDKHFARSQNVKAWWGG